MATASRWLSWQPAKTRGFELTTDKADKTVISEDGRNHSVSNVSCVNSDMADHDHRAWSDDFHGWASAECLYRDGSFQSIASLHIDFCEWAMHMKSVPCTRRVFERLLIDGGFQISDGFVKGFMLRCDYRAMVGAA